MIAKATPPMGSSLETEIVCSFSFYLFFWGSFLNCETKFILLLKIFESSSFDTFSLFLFHFSSPFICNALYCLWFRCHAVYWTNSMQKGDSKLLVTPFSDAWEMITTSYMQKNCIFPFDRRVSFVHEYCMLGRSLDYRTRIFTSFSALWSTFATSNKDPTLLSGPCSLYSSTRIETRDLLDLKKYQYRKR